MVDQEIFSRRLEALRGYLTKLRAFKQTAKDEFVREPALHDLAERYLHLMMECVLDLGNHYLADRQLSIASTNREIFLALRDAGELSAETAEQLCHWAGFRNILVHEYTRINHGLSWEAIQSPLAAIEQFYAWAASKLTLPPS